MVFVIILLLSAVCRVGMMLLKEDFRVPGGSCVNSRNARHASVRDIHSATTRVSIRPVLIQPLLVYNI
jgi:hypothetical protein